MPTIDSFLEGCVRLLNAAVTAWENWETEKAYELLLFSWLGIGFDDDVVRILSCSPTLSVDRKNFYISITSTHIY